MCKLPSRVTTIPQALGGAPYCSFCDRLIADSLTAKVGQQVYLGTSLQKTYCILCFLDISTTFRPEAELVVKVVKI